MIENPPIYTIEGQHTKGENHPPAVLQRPPAGNQTFKQTCLREGIEEDYDDRHPFHQRQAKGDKGLFSDEGNRQKEHTPAPNRTEPEGRTPCIGRKATVKVDEHKPKKAEHH